jgi:two-component system chemotaxis response regulator CheB
VKVLVVDDSALMRRALGSMMVGEPDLQVGYARDGREAIDMLHGFRPDVVTLDVQMPNMDGLACLDRIMLERPCRVLMLSSITEAGAAVTLNALALGAVDFIAKPAGTISLALDEFRPAFLAKLRSVAAARLQPAKRLTERVRLRTKGVLADRPRPTTRPTVAIAGSVRDGLVLVGTSTGGPPALDAVLSALPANFPWPVIVAQHMPAAFTASLARRLDGLCDLEVIEVTQAMPIVPGRVFIGRGDADIIVSQRPAGPVVMPAPSSAEHRWHPSVDRLVTTALQHLPAATLIGVLMTGMGNDGAAAMTRLRQEGGRTIAEAEETAVVWGMPGELVRSGGAQVVVPVQDIARQLLAWAA